MTDVSGLKELASKYLAAYAAKDLATIAELISESVSLQDWNVSGQGAKFFLNETEKNFQDAEKIEIQVVQLLLDENTVAARLLIVVDDSIELEVVDVITFDENAKIAALQAYKG